MRLAGVLEGIVNIGKHASDQPIRMGSAAPVQRGSQFVFSPGRKNAGQTKTEVLHPTLGSWELQAGAGIKSARAIVKALACPARENRVVIAVGACEGKARQLRRRL